MRLTSSILRYRIALGVLVVAGWVLPLGGCRSFGDADQIDRDVYGLVEDKWDDPFGSRTNYRLDQTTVQAARPVPPRSLPDLGRLTLPQAVALATSYSRDYQTEKERLYLSALDLRLTRHQFDLLTFGRASAGLEADRDDTVLGLEASAGFNRLLPYGTQVGVALTTAYADILSGNLRGGLASILDVTISQPLLRGSQRDIVLEPLTQAERNTLYAVRRFNRFRQSFVVDVIAEYYRTLLRLDRAVNMRDHLQQLQALEPIAEGLAEAGRISRIEVSRIQQEIVKAEEQTLRSLRLYQEALDAFKLRLGVHADAKFQLDEGELTRLHAVPLKLPGFTDQDVVTTALRQRLDLVNDSDRVIDAQRQVKVAEDRLRTELNLVASTRASTRRIGDRSRLQPVDESLGLGIEADLPVDRTTEETELRRAQIQLAHQQRLYEQRVDEVTLEVRRAYRALKEAADRYQVQARGVELAQKRLADAMTLLKIGRVSTRRVLSAQDDWTEAKNGRTEALVDFLIATLEFYRDAGVLRVKPDGMWSL